MIAKHDAPGRAESRLIAGEGGAKLAKLDRHLPQYDGIETACRVKPVVERGNGRGQLDIARAVPDVQKKRRGRIGVIGTFSARDSRLPATRRDRGQKQDEVELEHVAQFGLGEPVDMEALAVREVDHPLARQPIETVAHGGDADPQRFGDPRRIEARATDPFAVHQTSLDCLVGRLDDMRGTHCAARSAAANAATADAWSGRRASAAPRLRGIPSPSRTEGHCPS